MGIEGTQLTEVDLRRLLEKPLPTAVEEIEKELAILNGLGASPTELRNSIPDLDLRQRLMRRKGMLLKMEIVARAGLPVDMATREDAGSVLGAARECLETVGAIRKLLRKADALNLGGVIRERLGEELE